MPVETTVEVRAEVPDASPLCLELTNTVNWHAPGGRGRPDNWDRLASYRQLVGWGLRQRVLTAGQAKRLLRQARRRPEAAAAALERAIAVREAIYRIFSATAHTRSPDPADIATLNEALAGALHYLRVAAVPGGFRWEWAADPAGGEDALDRMIWPAVRSAAGILTSSALSRVRECANDPCGWLFLDASRNRSRRWCSMESCGNRAKARRHYQRRKAAGPERESPFGQDLPGSPSSAVQRTRDRPAPPA